MSVHIIGNYFKYRDYYCSVMGMKVRNIIPYIFTRFHTVQELEQLVNSYINPTFPLRTDDILQLCPF